MSSALPTAAQWLTAYEDSHDDYEAAADSAKQQILDALAGSPIAIHQVTARAKSIASVRGKLRDKDYDNPESQMTDLLGVRVITTYEHGVAAAVDAIRDHFRIDEPNSIDKTSKLGADRFGYRGIHLVAKVRTGAIDAPGLILGRTQVEIQVRSVVEHAWAEIEHELRYKSGVQFSDELNRRFNAIAGTLEIVDREFTSILKILVEGVRDLAKNLDAVDPDRALDTTSLLAILQQRRPDAPKAGPEGLKLPLGAAREFVALLKQSGIISVGGLNDAIRNQSVRNVVHDYALNRGTTAAAVSASAVLATVLGLNDLSALMQTELSTDQLLLGIIRNELAATIDMATHDAQQQ
ncbi:hypothetical protein [Arthrobacter sp. NPDC080082]|uniref:GTP pyrophosphokinase n=1 Tax=unclassified Arthrobacter TaxID=235627 RepID=UPI0034419838